MRRCSAGLPACKAERSSAVSSASWPTLRSKPDAGQEACATAKRKGQAAMEFALLYSAVVLPLTFMLVFVSEMLWTWHTAVDFTRSIAHFAATHCWQPDNSGSNVIGWATSHVPPMIDRDQFQSNAAGITVSYFTQNADGSQTPFDGAACNGGACVPDLVSVSITTYQFNRFSGFFRLGNVVMPPFTTVVPMESGGYQDASGVCVADAAQ